MYVSVPGSYNEWKVDDPGVRAELEDKKRYVFHRVLPRGIHRFKFVIDGDWQDNWGCGDQTRLVAPASGSLVKNGSDVIVNATDGGSYTFTMDLGQGTWMVEAAPQTTGLAQALNGVSGAARVQALLKTAQTPEGMESAAFLNSVAALLSEQARNGMLPLRNEEQVLFSYLAQSWETVHVAGSWLGWGENVLSLPRQDDSPVFARLLEVPAGVHRYKVVYNGQWSRDRYNPWVTPDRVPVPKFHLGEFNSVIAMNESPLVSGENLLWYPDFASVLLNNYRDIFVWLPPSYLTQRSRRFRTLYILDGNEALTRNFMFDTARELASSGVADDMMLVFVAFASNNERIWEMSDPEGRERYARFFVRELVPYIDSQFRTDAQPSARGISGISLGGNFAYYLAWKYPDVFGCASGQGVSWGFNQWETIKLYQSEPARPIRLYLDSSYASQDGNPDDSGLASRHAAAVLSELGYPVHHYEMPDQPHDWESWRQRQPELLRWFAPVTKSSRRRTTTPV